MADGSSDIVQSHQISMMPITPLSGTMIEMRFLLLAIFRFFGYPSRELSDPHIYDIQDLVVMC
jgi:hypothetical protein